MTNNSMGEEQIVSNLKQEMISGFRYYPEVSFTTVHDVRAEYSKFTYSSGGDPSIAICNVVFNLFKNSVDFFNNNDVTDIIIAALDVKHGSQGYKRVSYLDDTEFKMNILRFALTIEKLSEKQIETIFKKAQSPIWLNLYKPENGFVTDQVTCLERCALAGPTIYAKERISKLVEEAPLSEKRKMILQKILNSQKSLEPAPC